MLSQMPGARALQGTVGFQRDLFVKLILELRKCSLVAPDKLNTLQKEGDVPVQTNCKS